MLDAYFLLPSVDVGGINESTGFYGLTYRNMYRSYAKTSFEALLTTLCPGHFPLACGRFIRPQLILEGLSSDGNGKTDN